MRVYRVGYRRADDEHTGYSYHSSAKGARTAAGKSDSDGSTETTVIEVPLTKAGVLRALNVYGGHPDNG